MAKKILCIDDSVNLLQVLKKRFEVEIKGVQVLTTQSGREGLELARSEKPDLIILDIMMPDVNGDEVLDQLKHPKKKEHGVTKDIPIIILTAHGPEQRPNYIKAGAIDYISSPFDTNELVQKVKKVLSL